MADQGGITYSPHRVNPLATLQVANFSNINYLPIEPSEEEVEDQGT